MSSAVARSLFNLLFKTFATEKQIKNHFKKLLYQGQNSRMEQPISFLCTLSLSCKYEVTLMENLVKLYVQ